MPQSIAAMVRGRDDEAQMTVGLALSVDGGRVPVGMNIPSRDGNPLGMAISTGVLHRR